jgi:DNA mismatch repair protein MutS2
MIYPSDLESKLGFDQIRELLKSYAKGAKAVQIIEDLSPSYDVASIQEMLQWTEEFTFILNSGLYFPDKDFIDIEVPVKKLAIEGNYLEIDEWVAIKKFLSTFISCQSFFKKTEVEHLVHLQRKVIEIGVDPILYKTINRTLDDSGSIRDTASEILREIRSELIEERQRLRKEVDRLLRIFKKEGNTHEDAEATIRSGRLVLPVLAEYKRQIQGIIHDESGTGQTVFMEPVSLLPYNNRVRELEIQEHKEIVRILMDLTDFVRPFTDDLLDANQQVGWYDSIRSKASLAVQMNAVMPELTNEIGIDWKDAYHPILLLKNRKNDVPVIPLSIRLDDEQRLLILSGPNAGGKSVCMKTVGLLQYMLQCGLLIPVKKGSKSGIFREFFIDIGDAQSLDNDLSTYSSHIKNLTFFLQHVSARTLLLIDEFGSGTDPLYGTAVAESVLESLNEKKALGIVTTHYAGLKTLAASLPGLVNGSMRFDTKALTPLYQLDIGIPGSSFTLEIAEKSGLPVDRIDVARKKLNQEQVEFSQLIKMIEEERSLLQQSLLQSEKIKAENEKKQHEWNEKLKDIQFQRKLQIQEAKEEALRIVQTYEEKASAAYKSISQSSNKTEAQKGRTQLSDLSRELVPRVERKQEDEPIRLDWKIGDVVALRSNDAIGSIVKIKGKSAIVQLGDLKATVHFSELKASSGGELKKSMRKSSFSSAGNNINLLEKQLNFSVQLDIRGKRTEEAIQIVDRWLNDAFILGISELSILHGKGDGILRTMVRQHLQQYKQIKNIRDEHVDRGGAGITLFMVD